MVRHLIAPLASCAMLLLSFQVEAAPLKGDYSLFSGELGENHPTTKTDAKVSFMITGRLAVEMFDHLGAKTQYDECTSANVRMLRDVVCYRSAHETTCYFGLDLKTGKTTNGVIC